MVTEGTHYDNVSQHHQAVNEPTYRERETWPMSQKPCRLWARIEVDVVTSKISATAPPWRLWAMSSHEAAVSSSRNPASIERVESSPHPLHVRQGKPLTAAASAAVRCVSSDHGAYLHRARGTTKLNTVVASPLGAIATSSSFSILNMDASWN